jgi:hypothetical protein
MTDKVYSKYKFFGGFGVIIGLNLFVGFGVYKFLTDSNITRFGLVFIFVVQLLLLILLMSQCRFIITDKDGITFINPLLPFLKKKRTWDDFDYFITVDEESRNGTYEAVWLIKEEKIKERFSSGYYSNYEEIKKQIKTNWKGKTSFTSFGVLFAMLGLKKIKD